MIYNITEDSKNSIKVYSDIVELKVNDFSVLEDKNWEELIKKIVKDDQIISSIKFPDYVLNIILDYVVGKISIEQLDYELLQLNIPLYSIIISLVNNYRKKYITLCNLLSASSIVISCNSSNITKILSLSTKINLPVTINCTSISLEKYHQILENYNLDKLEELGIKICYQDFNRPISPKRLYHITSIMCKEADKIKDKNLSPFEIIIYFYDFVKQRHYQKNDINPRKGRDLDFVLLEEDIVCVGYSNLFNAFLKIFNIKASPLISLKNHHQRSLVLIDDYKYNIHGIYTFDPTWDRITGKKEINNYNYFASKLEVSNVTCPLDDFQILSFKEIVDIFNSRIMFNDMEKQVKISNYIRKMFNFTNTLGYEEFIEKLGLFKYCTEEERNNLYYVYQELISKYFPKNISNEVLVKAISNVREIQISNNIISSYQKSAIISSIDSRNLNFLSELLLADFTKDEHSKIRKKKNN